MIKTFIFKNIPNLLIGGLFIIMVLGLWPGIIQVDSLGQYQQALNNSYTSHHPPLMSFMWHLMMKVVPGYGGQFLLQMVMLWSAAFIFTNTLVHQRLKYIIPVVLLTAHIIGYP